LEDRVEICRIRVSVTVWSSIRILEVFAVTIAERGRGDEGMSTAEVFSWSELPELLAAEDLFDGGDSGLSSTLLPAHRLIAGDEDDDFEDEDDDFEDDEDDEEYDDEEDDEEDEEDDEEEGEEWEEVDDEEEEEEEEEEEDEEYEDDEDEDWEEDDEEDEEDDEEDDWSDEDDD